MMRNKLENLEMAEKALNWWLNQQKENPTDIWQVGGCIQGFAFMILYNENSCSSNYWPNNQYLLDEIKNKIKKEKSGNWLLG